MTAELIRWFYGSRDFRVPPDAADKAADLLTKSGADFRHMHAGEKGLTFSLPIRDCVSIEHILANNGIKYETLRDHGFRYLIRRYRRRIGIPIGAVLFAFILWFSEQFIWTVDVVGNANISAPEIIERLEALGCGVGTYIPGVDFDELHNRFLLKYNDVSWISVNVRGTAATVEVREMELPDTVIDENTPYNLVASEDGVIEYMEILRGKPVARVDELVRKGELLASGIEEGKHSLSLVHARGKVLAKVKRSVRIEVPLETTRREATGAEYTEKYLNIFGISLKFFANTGNMASEYDKIEYEMLTRSNNLRFFDAVELPIAVDEAVFVEYAQIPITYTEEEARTEAYRRLREECAAITEGCELVSREISAGLSGGVYTIDCELTVISDIAEELPIYTD
ncbi:MAG: sporulation protein YqfD [Clostridia bacterium]|nr:sporulation protein YqfD [Clostridia bacterium]